MHRQKRPSPADRVEEAVRRAASIGDLERLAGIEQTEAARYAFWTAYTQLPGAQSLDAGCAELKRRIHAEAASMPAHHSRRTASR